jgi:hypothetical protein
MQMFQNLERFFELVPEEAPGSLTDLPSGLRIFSGDDIDVWYAPLGEGPRNPRLSILGITPGWTQMRIAYADAADWIRRGKNPKEACEAQKPNVAFAGTMRTNLVKMLDELDVPAYCNAASIADLFGSEQLHTDSAFRYPVFVNGKNYTGHKPKPLSCPVLREMIDSVLGPSLKARPNTLLVPLGKAVEDVLQYCQDKGWIDQSQILSGFPHPSGANGHRHKQFAERRLSMRAKVKNWYETSA